MALFLVALPTRTTAAFDPQKLDARVDIKLTDASMADAVEALAKLAGIEIAAPAGPPEAGFSASLKQQTLWDVLDILAEMSGMSWYIEDEVIVFRKPETPGDTPSALIEKLTPEEGMTVLLGSLDESQLLFISWGTPLSYADLMPFQQHVLKAMLSPPAVGITDSGTIVKSLPKPEQATLSFWVMPSLVIPKSAGGRGLTLRLDSAPYIHLKKPAQK